jgi:hypothetical protein
LAVLLLLLIKFGRRKPAAAPAEAPPVAEPDAGLHRNFGLPTLPGAIDGDFFGTAAPDDEDFRSWRRRASAAAARAASWSDGDSSDGGGDGGGGD